VMAEAGSRTNTPELENTKDIPAHPYYWQQKRSARYSQKAQ
jgi:hypothetical protein